MYESYGAWIRGKVRSYLPDAWEDGVQEVLVKLQPALGARPPSAPRVPQPLNDEPAHPSELAGRAASSGIAHRAGQVAVRIATVPREALESPRPWPSG